MVGLGDLIVIFRVVVLQQVFVDLLSQLRCDLDIAAGGLQNLTGEVFLVSHTRPCRQRLTNVFLQLINECL